MITLSDRSSTFTDSVIRRMSRVCAKYGALNLAQGFPDYNPPEPILERLSKVAFEGPHQYATTWGDRTFAKRSVKRSSTSADWNMIRIPKSV